jgi:hypothetical protein
MKKLFKKIVDFVKRVTIIDLGFVILSIVVVWGVYICNERRDSGYVVTDRKTGECFLFRKAEWECNGCHRHRELSDIFFYGKGNSEIRAFEHAKYMVESYGIPPEYSSHCSR